MFFYLQINVFLTFIVVGLLLVVRITISQQQLEATELSPNTASAKTLFFWLKIDTALKDGQMKWIT